MWSTVELITSVRWGGFHSCCFFPVRNFHILNFNFQSGLPTVDCRCFPLAFLLCAIRFLCEKCNYLSSDLSSLANGRWQHSLKVAVFHSDIYIVIVVEESWEPKQQLKYPDGTLQPVASL